MNDDASAMNEDASNATRRRLVWLLRAAVARGDFVDARIPSDEELAASYSTSRSAMRDALVELTDMGVITRTRGVGTHAADTFGATFNLLAFHGVAGVPQQRTHPRAVTVATIPTFDALRARLPNATDEVLRVEYVSAPDGQADGVSTSYFVLPRAEALRTAAFGENIYAFMEAGGLEVGFSDFLVGAIGADQATARRLRVAEGAALVTLEQTMFDHDGIPLCFTTIAVRGDRIGFFSRARRDDAV